MGVPTREVEMATATNETVRAVRIPAGRVMLQGDLIVPTRARGVVLFAHGGRIEPPQPSQPRCR